MVFQGPGKMRLAGLERDIEIINEAHLLNQYVTYRAVDVMQQNCFVFVSFDGTLSAVSYNYGGR